MQCSGFPHQPATRAAPMERQYVGIDLDRRSSTIYRMNAEGEMLGCVRIPSPPAELAEAMAEAGEAPELRGLVRYRFRLLPHRSSAKAQVRGVMAKNGILPAPGRHVGTGRRRAARLPRAAPGPCHAPGLPSGPDRLPGQRDRHLRPVHPQPVEGRPGYNAIQTVDGIGKVLGAVFVAEIGDVTRFSSSKQLCSWAGLTPRHRESDEKVRRGRSPRGGGPEAPDPRLLRAPRRRDPLPRTRGPRERTDTHQRELGNPRGPPTPSAGPSV